MYRIRMLAAVALVSLIEIVPLSSAVAQTVSLAQTETCAEHTTTALESVFFALNAQLDNDLKYQRIEPASETFRKLMRLTERYPDAEWRASRLTGLISDDVMSSDPSQWQRWINQTVEQGATPATFAALTAAVEVTQTLSSGYSVLKTNTFRAIAHAYHRLDRPNEAEAVLQLALQATETIQGAEFTAQVLPPIARVYAGLGDQEQAESVLQQALTQARAMEHPDPFHRAMILSQIAVAYAEIGQFDPALAVIRSLEDSPEPQGMAFLEVVQGYLTKNQPDEAEQLAQTIPHLRYRAIALKDIAQYYQAQSQPDQVDALFQQAIEAAQHYNTGEPTDWEYTLAQIIKAYGQWQPATALPLAQSIQDTEKRAEVLTALALSFQAQEQTAAANEVVPQAIAALQQVSSDWQGMLVYRLVEEAIAAKSFDLALQLSASVTDPFVLYDRTQQVVAIVEAAVAEQQFDVAQRALASFPVEQQEPRSLVLKALAVGYVNANQPNAALTLVDQIDPASPMHRVRVLGAIARQLLLTGNTDPAFAVFDQAQQVARTLNTPSERITALGTLLMEYETARQPLDAALLQHLADAVRAEDPAVASSYTHALVTQLMQDKHLNTALQVAALMPEDHYRTSSLEAVGRLAFEADQPDTVLAAVDRLTDPAAKVRLLQLLADRALYDSEPEAASLLQRMVDIAQTMPDPESRVLVFGNEGGTVVEDESDRASTYEAIALRYGMLGQQPKALQVAGLIQDATLRDRVNQRLLCLQ